MADSKKQLAALAFQSADQIRQRLFDHKQFTSGEIAFVVREFEEKRQDREAQVVRQSALAVNDMRNRLMTVDSGLAGDRLSRLSDRIDTLIGTSQGVLETLEGYELQAEEREKSRQERAKEMQIQFEHTVALGKNELNSDLDQQITQLRHKYSAIEKSITAAS